MPILSWEGRGQKPSVPYCLLEHRGQFGNDQNDNLLLQGDNLTALKALLPHYAGQVKCVFIDPPYNTGNAFEHYDDNLEHSRWLDLMYPRLVLLRNLLANNGSIWVTIDDDESHYLKVIMDEIFGRKNFMANLIWNSTKSVTNTAIISAAHTHILLYFKDKKHYVKNRLDFRLPEDGDGFSNPDNDPRGAWKADPFQVGGWRPNQQYKITNSKTGKVYLPNPGNSWKNDHERFKVLMKENRIVFGVHGDAGPQRKRFLSEAQDRGKVATTIWTDSNETEDFKLIESTVWDDVETTTNGTRHSKELFGVGHNFKNPKPEKLIQRILHLATNPGDLVLDSFLGSGTTAAAAHKMQRRWIGIEMGEHAKTHCIPRLQKVIEGEQGGISVAEEWKGGGGFYFMTLGNPIFDDEGNVNPQLDFASLAAYIWFYETKTPLAKAQTQKIFLGEHNNIGYALLYNGVIKDKSVKGGNALTNETLKIIRDAAPKDFAKKIIVYGNISRLQKICLQDENLEFRQIPFSLKNEEK